MADFAPTHMDVYDKDQSEVTVLAALTLSADEFEEGSSADTEIGDLTGVSSGSVLSLPYAGADFGLDGNTLVVGPTGGDLAVGDHKVVVVENNAYASNSPRATELTITVTAGA